MLFDHFSDYYTSSMCLIGLNTLTSSYRFTLLGTQVLNTLTFSYRFTDRKSGPEHPNFFIQELRSFAVNCTVCGKQVWIPIPFQFHQSVRNTHTVELLAIGRNTIPRDSDCLNVFCMSKPLCKDRLYPQCSGTHFIAKSTVIYIVFI